MPRVEVGMSSGWNDDDDMYDANNILRDFADANKYFENFEEEPNADAKKFYNMVNDASEPIYPNNKNYTRLSFVSKLLHFKNKHHCSNNGFVALLCLIGSVLAPMVTNFPAAIMRCER